MENVCVYIKSNDGAHARIVCKFIRIRIIKMKEPMESNGVGKKES